MSWYGLMMAGLFPRYATRRTKALRQHRALYEAEKVTRTYRRKKAVGGPNTATKTAPKNLREVAREFDENNDVASGALDIMVANIVGTGVVPQPMVLNTDGTPNEEVNASLEAWHRRWREHPEVTWQLDDAMSQRLACRSWLRDGESLRQDIVGPRRGLSHFDERVQYSYELMEADFLPSFGERITTNATGELIAGVERNAWGRPTFYHLFLEHPGESGLDLAGGLRSVEQRTKRVAADRIVHLKMVKRIGQVRGVSVFANVIKRLNDLDELDESERVAARVAAAFAAVIVKGEPLMYDAPSEDEENYRELDLEPGMIMDDLMPGEKVESIGSNRPNNALIPFRADQLRAAAGGLGVSYSSLSKNYNGTYSAQRQELVEQRQLYAPLWQCFVATSEVPKWRHFVQAMQLSRRLTIPAGVDMDTLFDAVYTQPAIPWIQPVQEADGWAKLIELGVETRANVIRSRGGNPRDIQRQLELEGGNPEPEQEPEPQPAPAEQNQPISFKTR